MTWETIAAPGASIRILRGFLSKSRADVLLLDLIETVPWRKDVIRVMGKVHDLPRMQQWYGDAGVSYTWSGIHMEPLPWSPVIAPIRKLVEGAVGSNFNSALVNYYRDGEDTVGWHADDEPEIGREPVIASLSVGSERDFDLRSVKKDDKIRIALPPGSILVMSGATQRNWQHCLPRRKSIQDPRVNLTFRLLASSQEIL